ncbi:hypothetical protein AB1Y20_020751 [Prymnesium parvum]|uniref:Magnesium transporter n=1 Tax=Prymnesium parvum TaxID=97485 RepID=A0AB34JZ22_PRYPA
MHEVDADEGSGSSESSFVDTILIFVGIFLGITASIGINIGNNIQSLGLQRQAEQKGSRLFATGTVIFVTASVVNFAAFAFAPAAILAPLESFQFVSNLFFNHYVNKKVITRRMITGVSMVIVGCGTAVGLGPNEVYEFTLMKLVDFWTEPAWCGYLVGIMLLAAVAQGTNMLYMHRQSQGNSMPYERKVLPITFALSSALIGTQSVVQAKCLSECLEQLTAHGVNIFAYWYFWMSLFLFVSLVAIWLYRLTKALEHFDPLFIIPMLQSNYILFATVSGGIYFQEFNSMKAYQWAGFVIGILVMFCGLYLLSPHEDEAESSSPPAEVNPVTIVAESADCSGPRVVVGRLVDKSDRVSERANPYQTATSTRRRSSRILLRAKTVPTSDIPAAAAPAAATPVALAAISMELDMDESSFNGNTDLSMSTQSTTGVSLSVRGDSHGEALGERV